MPYSISDTGPAGYDLQRRSLEADRQKALVSTLLSVWAQTQDQSMNQQRLGLEQERIGVSRDDLEQQRVRDAGQMKYWDSQADKEPTVMQRYQTALKIFNGDEKAAWNWTYNPNWIDPKTKRIAENQADNEVPVAGKAPMRDLGKEWDEALEKVDGWEVTELARLKISNATKGEDILSRLGIGGTGNGAQKVAGAEADIKAMARQSREAVNARYGKYAPAKKGGDGGGDKAVKDLDGVRGAVRKTKVPSGQTVYIDANGKPLLDANGVPLGAGR